MVARLELRVLRLDDGRDLAFAEYGDPSGAPVFAFHGTPGSHTQAQPLHPAALAGGVRLIVPDRPGYGHSTFDRSRTLTGWPDDVAAVAGALEIDRFGVVGISGGGPHAAVAAHALGERLTGCAIVSGVGPLNAPEDSEGMMPFNRMLAALARRAPSLLRVPFAALDIVGRLLPEERLIEQMTNPLPPADVEIITRPEIREAMLVDIATRHPTRARAAAQDFALFARPWGFELDDISTPVSLWHGDEDVNVPFAHGQRYVDLIPGASLNAITGAGHMLFVDHAPAILTMACGTSPD
ncbi:MAG: alpha/beta hydrolase [Acidimicrobiia bacterium]|nr:alpha/beta hydrolase [Acidimicrobiia bacterium]